MGPGRCRLLGGETDPRRRSARARPLRLPRPARARPCLGRERDRSGDEGRRLRRHACDVPPHRSVHGGGSGLAALRPRQAVGAAAIPLPPCRSRASTPRSSAPLGLQPVAAQFAAVARSAASTRRAASAPRSSRGCSACATTCRRAWTASSRSPRSQPPGPRRRSRRPGCWRSATRRPTPDPSLSPVAAAAAAGGVQYVSGLSATPSRSRRWAPLQQEILRTAVSLDRLPLRLGRRERETERGFDCSGFVWRVFKLAVVRRRAGLADRFSGRTPPQMAREVPRAGADLTGPNSSPATSSSSASPRPRPGGTIGHTVDLPRERLADPVRRAGGRARRLDWTARRSRGPAAAGRARARAAGAEGPPRRSLTRRGPRAIRSMRRREVVASERVRMNATEGARRVVHRACRTHEPERDEACPRRLPAELSSTREERAQRERPGRASVPSPARLPRL